MASQQEDIVQRVRTAGVKASATVDLVAVAFSRRESDAQEAGPMSRKVMTKFTGLQGLGEASPEDIRDATGLESFEILRCQSLMELGRRTGGAGKGPVSEIRDSSDVFVLLDHLRFEKREHFFAILLNTKNGIIRSLPVHIGTLDASLVGPREIFREAIREGASSLIVAHNHPSGDPTPSQEDRDITGKLAEIGEMLQIPLLDHVIIGERRFHSFRDRGDL
ncbi:MAG: DNA repair protein RadC [Fimbriimonas ginsengisoli]|uniref:DNA repair protein RadC n=1 Tax=Fimbriimonas ginsengisoli TaxID=1005039 RepID=A0A931PU54_FIMGI|nr:DNA repair protein RadC [Fimbriimonas ginsengisoli]